MMNCRQRSLSDSGLVAIGICDIYQPANSIRVIALTGATYALHNTDSTQKQNRPAHQQRLRLEKG